MTDIDVYISNICDGYDTEEIDELAGLLWFITGDKIATCPMKKKLKLFGGIFYKG